MAGGKELFIWIYLNRYERIGKNPDENSFTRWDWVFILLLLAAAYGLPALGIVIPSQIIVALMLVVMIVGIWAVKKAVDFPSYRELCQQMLADKKNGMDAKVTSQQILEESNRKKISQDTSITSNKRGLEYFNELFVKRHRKILWNSVKRIAVVCLGVVALACAICLWKTEAAKGINEGLMKLLPVCLLVMYALNRGTTFTQALFINCDHSMLTYAFYKKPGTVLKLFWIRLRELVKINLLPVIVIGGGLSLLLYVSGGTAHPVDYAVITVSVLAMSVFFSVHYLTMYYLLQPYTSDAQIKSGVYKVVSWATYFFSYMMMQVRMNSVLFGGVMIGFTVLYCIIAGILVYRLAGKTFRLRS